MGNAFTYEHEIYKLCKLSKKFHEIQNQPSLSVFYILLPSRRSQTSFYWFSSMQQSYQTEINLSASPDPSGHPQANVENLPDELKLHIFKYVLYPEGNRSKSNVVVHETPSSNGTGMQYSVKPVRWNISILLTSKAIYPAAMDVLYSYMSTRLTLDLTLESSTHFLLNVISPDLLKRIRSLTFMWKAALQRGTQHYVQQRDAEWFVRQVLIGRMASENGGRLSTVGISLPRGFDSSFQFGRTWIWGLPEQLVRAFVRGWFGRVWFVHRRRYFEIEIDSPCSFDSVMAVLSKIILGNQRSAAIRSESEACIRHYLQQHPGSSHTERAGLPL